MLGALYLERNGETRHIANVSKLMRASKDIWGKAEHVLSAFCVSLQSILGVVASRDKGLEIPDALKLSEPDLKLVDRPRGLWFPWIATTLGDPRCRGTPPCQTEYKVIGARYSSDMSDPSLF